jgi:CDP-4-dehydro-6-deoxyglucose reductase
MSHLLTLSRVARLVGISRGELQRMARRGALATFDGQVELEEVLRVFPDIKLEDDTEIIRVEHLKEAALAKAGQARELPDARILSERLMALGQEYASAKSLVRHYQTVLRGLETKLEGLEEQGDLKAGSGRELIGWLRNEAASPPEEIARLQRLIAKESIMRIMSANVKVLPKGQRFVVEGSESLLEAGLKAGVALGYGCSNGSCGACKARVVAGEVTKVRPHDYRLTEAEKVQGYTLLCSYAPVADVTIEALVDHAGDIARQTIKARVRMLERLGEEVVAVHLLTPIAQRLRFLAGQRVLATIGETSGEVHLASCPCEDRRLELHVAHQPGSAFAEKVFGGLTANDEVVITGPIGSFVLADEPSKCSLFIAEGIGYAPLKSLVQHALSLDEAMGAAVLWLGGRTGHYQENLLRSYAHALDTFGYHPLDDEAALADRLDGIGGRKEGFGSYDVYAAGSAGFLARTKAQLIERGLPEASWRGEVAE